MKLTVAELGALRIGTEVTWIFSSGSEIRRHRAIVKRRDNKSLLLHVFFGDGVPDTRRWSLVTNQPVSEYRGHTGGKVWLERYAESAQS
jgi:hypothetical protein